MAYKLFSQTTGAKGSLTPPDMELTVKKKGRQPLGFKEYGSDETHPSKTFNAALKALGASITRPSSAPLDFQPGELPRQIPVVHAREARDPVAALHQVGAPEESLRIWYTGISRTSEPYSITYPAVAYNADEWSFTPPSYTTSPPGLTFSETTSPSSALSSPPSELQLDESEAYDDDDEADDALSTQSAPDRGETVAFKTDSQKRFEAGVNAMGSNVRLTFPTIGKGYTNLKQAQSIYTPDACLLIGNLPADIPDEILSITVQHEFSVYGRCFACVFRGKGATGYYRPYGIVQFTHIHNAARAFAAAQDLEIWGRSVRVERSNRRFS